MCIRDSNKRFITNKLKVRIVQFGNKFSFKIEQINKLKCNEINTYKTVFEVKENKERK